MPAAHASLFSRTEFATRFRPPGYSKADCALLASLPPDPVPTFTIESNPDIAGIGVILAFLITAYATLIFTIGAYWIGLVPEELLNAVDKKVFGARSERRPGWSEAFKEGIRAFSDQQIVTGIAILASAFATVKTISVYHWRTVVYLAWMSSNVHLTTLTVLRRLLQGNGAARAMRLTGMLVLMVLLVFAMVPTASNSFGDAVTNIPYEGEWVILEHYTFTPADPAACFWHRQFITGISKDALLSYVMLIGSYMWKMLSLFSSTHKVAKEILRDRPARVIPRLIRKLALWRNSNNRFVYWLTAWPHSVLVGLYVLYIAVFDFLNSFAASVVILTISLAWGTVNLILPREYLFRYVQMDENDWGFGQYLPILLLLLPVMSVAEEFSVRKGKPEPESPDNSNHHHARIPTTSSATGSDTYALLSHHRTWTSAGPPSRADTQASSNSLLASPSPLAPNLSPSSSPSPSPFSSTPPPPPTREIHIRNLDLAAAAVTAAVPPPKPPTLTTTTIRPVRSTTTLCSLQEPEPGPARDHDAVLYASRFFRSLVWLAVVSVVLVAAWVFFLQWTSLANGFVSGRVVDNVGWGVSLAAIVMGGWVAVGAAASRVGRGFVV